MASVVSVEEVTRGKALARFTELPQALHGSDPRFAPLLMAWERYRLDDRRNPYLERGEAVYLLARRMGRPAGRIAAHVPEPGGEGRFGFWWLDDDAEVAQALMDAAVAWLDERGCRSMVGPSSFTDDEEVGVQVAGHEVAGTTGRPWHPPHLGRLLEEHGFVACAEHRSWRLPTGGGATVAGDAALAETGPGQAGPYLDRRLVLPGIAAVPDLSAALRAVGLRGALSLARRARAAAWEGCTVVWCHGDAPSRVPALQAAAGDAGYEWVVAPWSPDRGAVPEAVHRQYRLTW